MRRSTTVLLVAMGLVTSACSESSSTTGALVREQPLGEYADVLRFDPATLVPTKLVNADIRRLPDPVHPLAAGEQLHVHPQWHTNLVAGGYHWFLCTTNNRRNGLAPAGHSGPAYSLGRVDVETGRVEYMELPVGVDAAGEPKYGKPLRTKTVDARGIEIADEDRSRTDGWEIDAFFPSPVQLGAHLYFTTMLGTVYVVDAAAPVLDARARIVEGAVSMVKMALDRLQHDGVVELDTERKAQMVSNLLVVLCSDKDAQPIVNAGTLYALVVLFVDEPAEVDGLAPEDVSIAETNAREMDPRKEMREFFERMADLLDQAARRHGTNPADVLPAQAEIDAADKAKFEKTRKL